MRINTVSPISFKAHFVNVDIGASSTYGSMKIRTLDDKGNLIDYKRTTVFNQTEARNEKSFEENVARKVLASETLNKDAISKADPDNEMFLTVCYPGPKVNENGKVHDLYDKSNSSSFVNTICFAL